jgi:hypothetical protein
MTKFFQFYLDGLPHILTQAKRHRVYRPEALLCETQIPTRAQCLGNRWSRRHRNQAKLEIHSENHILVGGAKRSLINRELHTKGKIIIIIIIIKIKLN